MSTYPVIKLGSGDIPGIGYGVGTAWFKAPETDNGVNRPLVDAVKLALKSGYTHLDNAEAYENEASVGAAIKESGVARETLYITTKIGAGRDDIAGNFKKQCVKLGVTFVDLYLLHWPTAYDLTAGVTKPMPSNVECWAEMEKLKDAGVVGEIGVSNYRISDLEPLLAMAKHKPVCNQIEMHPYVYERSEPLLAFLEKENIRVEAYGPSQPITKFAGGPIDPVLEKIAAAVSSRAGGAPVSPSQVLLQLSSQLGNIVITTSGKDWRMKEQLSAGGLPHLTEDEIKELLDVSKNYHRRTFMLHMDT